LFNGLLESSGKALSEIDNRVAIGVAAIHATITLTGFRILSAFYNHLPISNKKTAL
jgi:hypothetical protein